ncbi:predicted integral membrane protein [Clostridium sp. CAG:510]|nr:predicted integral membrane protein [Clostridium sp. CAG:510]
MKFFSTDSPLYRFLTRLWDMIKLNFLWLIFSLPVVTMGAATVAAYSVTLKMVDEREGYVGRQFIKAFKENWKQGIPLGLIFLAAVYAAYLDFEFFNKLPDNPLIFLIAGIITIFFIVMIFLYAFPLSARYENTLLETMKNGIRIATKFFVRTIFLIAILAIEVMIFIWNQTTLLFGILIGPACFMLTVSGFAMYYFRQIEKEPGAITNPDDNV